MYYCYSQYSYITTQYDLKNVFLYIVTIFDFYHTITAATKFKVTLTLLSLATTQTLTKQRNPSGPTVEQYLTQQLLRF